MAVIGSIKVKKGKDPAKALKKMTKNIWTREFMQDYKEKVVFYVKPSEKRRKRKKR